MVPLEVLDLEVVLILEFADLHVLHVFDVGGFFLELFDLIEELSVFEVAGGGPGD